MSEGTRARGRLMPAPFCYAVQGFLRCLVACCSPGVPGAALGRGFDSPHLHNMVLLVFRVPEAPAVGPGRCVCRWAAARPRDRHTRACGSEWSISRPALALPPPTGTATRPRHRLRVSQPGPSGALHTCGAWSLMCYWVRCFGARPGPAAAHGCRSLALRSLWRPSHQWGLVCWRVAWRVGSMSGQSPPPPINFACNSPADPSNYEFTTLGLQRFQPLLKPLPIELHASFWGSGHIDTCW